MYASKLMEKEFIRRCDLVRWDKGVGAGIHVDIHQYYEDLTYSAVIYMNDNFDPNKPPKKSPPISKSFKEFYLNNVASKVLIN